MPFKCYSSVKTPLCDWLIRFSHVVIGYIFHMWEVNSYTRCWLDILRFFTCENIAYRFLFMAFIQWKWRYIYNKRIYLVDSTIQALYKCFETDSLLLISSHINSIIKTLQFTQCLFYPHTGFIWVLENLESHGILCRVMKMENLITINYELIFIVYHNKQTFHKMYFTELWIISHGKDGKSHEKSWNFL